MKGKKTIPLCLFAPLTFFSLHFFPPNWSCRRPGTDFGMPADWLSCDKSTSVPLLAFCDQGCHTRLVGATGLIVWRECNMRLRLRSLVRESRVALSCVAWNGGSPFVHWGQALRDAWWWEVFSFRWLWGRMVATFLWSWFPGCSVLFMSFLALLCLVSPVNWVRDKWW